MNTKKLLPVIAIILAIAAVSVAAVILWVNHKKIDPEYYFAEVADPSDFTDFEVKSGKYYLQRTWGYDETDYIEIFDDGTIQFTGEYWENNDEETRLFIEKEGFAEGLDVFYTQRQKYCTIPTTHSIAFLESTEKAYELGMFTSIRYIDENILEVTRKRSQEDDVVDYIQDDADIVTARYIYSE